MEQLNDLYFSRGCCNPFGEDLEGVPNLNDGEDYFSEWFSMDDALAFVKNVYEGKGNKDDTTGNKKRANQYAKVLNEAVEKGWGQSGKKTVGIDFDSPDTKMLNALRDNIWQFSAAKTDAERQELNALLRDSKGKLRTWQDFKHEAQKVTTTFQEHYLKVEYDTAVNSAYLAARWQEFDDDDILIFRTAGDDRVRDTHKVYDGIALPKKHEFWKTHYPPLSWNCRCTVEVSTGRRTPDDQIPQGISKNIPPNFGQNFAEKGVVFPPGGSYKNAVGNTGNAPLSFSDANYKSYQRIGKNGTIYETDLRYKPTKSVAERIRKENEWHKRYNVADKIADLYNTDVFIPPTFRGNDDWRYRLFYKNIPVPGKMPDIYYNGKWWEVESYQTNFFDIEKTVRRMLKEGKKQSDRIILYMNHDYDLGRIKDKVEGYVKKNPFIKEVKLFTSGGDLVDIYKETAK